MRSVLIYSAIACALGIAWLAGSRYVTILLDQLRTVRVASLPVSPLTYSNGGLQVGAQPLSLPSGVEMRRDARNRIVLTSGGKDFPLGPGKPSTENEITPEPGDEVSLDIDRSMVSWPTPFEMNFMTGAAPSWKRYLYYRFDWKKPSGARLSMVWRYEQWFYTIHGWTGLGGMTSLRTTGLMKSQITF